MIFSLNSRLKNKLLRYYKYYIYVVLAILLLNVFLFIYNLSQASRKIIKPTTSHVKTNTGIYEERKENKIDKNYINNARRAWNKKYGHVENEAHQGILYELDNLDDYFHLETKSEFIQNKLQNLVNQIGNPSESRKKYPPNLSESHIKNLNAWLIHHSTSKNQTQPTKYYMNLISRVSQLLCESRVVYTDLMTKGTQLKLLLTLESTEETGDRNAINPHPLDAMNSRGNQRRRSQVRVVFKPKWYNNTESFPNIVDGKDRHYGEFIAFFLSLLLELFTVPVVQLRSFSMQQLLTTGSERFNATLFEKNSQLCVKGKCMYCSEENSLCVNQHSSMVQGAVIVYLEETLIAKVRNPYQRSYNSNKPKSWEGSASYCHSQLVYKYDREFLLDLVDISVFDYLIQNGDRHHLDNVNGVTFKHGDTSNNEMRIGDKSRTPPSHQQTDKYLLLDNGKSFGQPSQDTLDVLAPLYQCCVMRSATYNRLVQLRGGLLTKTLKQLSKHSACPLSASSEEVLTEAQWRAMERRLSLIYATVNYCMRKHHGKTILVH